MIRKSLGLADFPDTEKGLWSSGYPAIIFLLWAVFIAIFIGNRGLWSPDEPRYLQVAWEMATAKQYLIPIFNGDIYPEKPPLYFWLTILAARLVDFENATRWVSAVAGLGTLLLTFGIGARLATREIGFLAAVILMTSGLFALLLTTGNIDMLLTFFTTLGIYCFIRFQSGRRNEWLVAAYLSCGMGILAKGPVGFILPWLLFIVWTFYNDASGKKPAWKHLLWGPLIALVPVFLWLVPAILAGGEEYARTILIRQNLGRAAESFSHAEPWYTYFLILPLQALPWTFALPAALPEVFRAVREKKRAPLFLACWIMIIFVFFTMISGKRDRYLLPLYPALALMVAYGLALLENLPERKNPWFYAAGGLIAVGLLGMVLFPSLQPVFAEKYADLSLFDLGGAGWRIWGLYAEAVLGAVALGLGFFMLFRRRPVGAAYGFALALLFVSSGVQMVYLPALNQVKSARFAAERVEALISHDGKVAFYKETRNEGWNFYLRRPVIPVVSEGEMQGADHNVVIVREKQFGKDPGVFKLYKNADNVRVGSDRFYLLAPDKH